jgi:hypothetical protein
MLEKLHPSFRIYQQEPPATAKDLKALEAHFGEIPPDYRALLQETGELSVEHENSESFTIWSSARCRELDLAYHIRDSIPDGFPVGDDGKNHVIYYHNGKRGYGLYLVGFGCLDPEEAIWLTDSITSLLHDASGMDVIEDPYRNWDGGD